jgi:two-component system sensor histidine kinase KdpD
VRTREPYSGRVLGRPNARGRLRIYLGAAAGVGKTYQMLGDALLDREDGVDIVIGYLEPHGRRGTEERARNLERAPTRTFGGGGRAETEPDVAWLLERRPTVALVDELAHTCPPDAPSRKRYEDVERLLGAGIQVWTTVNIQHVEGLNDRVRALTGVEVRETLPDRFLRDADELRLVDLNPAALRERIARGLVYPAEHAERALAGFFTVENLTALRALVLHELAEIAAADARRVLGAGATGATERVLVGTGGRRESATRLIRAGERLAERLAAELFVLVVEPSDRGLDPATAEVLAEAERLTLSCGGIFLRRRADDAADQLVREIAAQGITQVVLGESRQSGLRRLTRQSLVEVVLRRTHGVDVHVMAEPVDARGRAAGA